MARSARRRLAWQWAGTAAMLCAASTVRADILEFSPPLASDPPTALRVANLSKMPATLHTLTWRFAGGCQARRVLGLAVAPGASVVVQPDNTAELLACTGAAAPRELAGFARPQPPAGSALARSAPARAADARGAAVDVDAEIELPQRRLTQRAALQLLYR